MQYITYIYNSSGYVYIIVPLPKFFAIKKGEPSNIMNATKSSFTLHARDGKHAVKSKNKNQRYSVEMSNRNTTGSTSRLPSIPAPSTEPTATKRNPPDKTGWVLRLRLAADTSRDSNAVAARYFPWLIHQKPLPTFGIRERPYRAERSSPYGEPTP